MNAEEPIEPEASTVPRLDVVSRASSDLAVNDPGSSQRSASQRSSSHGSSNNGGVSAPKHDSVGSASQEIAEAKTVIRQKKISNAPGQQPGRTPADVARVLVGQQLNQYHLEEMIGGGGMGAVFRAHDQQLDRTVAIKVIPFVGNDPEMQRRFRNEAQNAAKLDHPRIARVYDAGSHDEWHYIVFEYIRGTNLRDLVNGIGVLTLDDAVYYSCQLADALQHSADRGIVHRDIKPSNVLIGDGDTIKLVDMGLARSDNLDLSEDMTASGVTLGTFDYISPEQALDPRDADLRSDIYSLGCTLFFMLTGQPPYTGGTMLQKLLSHGNAPLPNAKELRSGLPDDLIAVMQRMMAKEPKQRYQTASDLEADLLEVAYRHHLTRSLSLGAKAPTPPNELAVWFQSHAPWMVAVFLVLCVAGWLELSAGASREGFEITAPENVALSQPKTTETDTGLRSPTSPETDGSAAGPLEDPNSVFSPSPNLRGDDPAEPPTMGIPIPDPLTSTESNLRDDSLPPRAMSDTIDAESLTADDPVIQMGPDEFPPDAFGGRPGEMIEPSTPELIRLVGPEAVWPESPPDSLFAQDEDGAAMVRSLENALQLAQQLEIDRIEIAATSVICGPLDIERDNLTIVSTAAQGTSIELRQLDAYEVERSQMLTVGSNRVTLQGLHFEWELSADQTDGGSLMILNDNRLVRIRDSSFTVKNPSGHENVFVISVLTAPEPDETPTEPLDGTTLPLVAIQLDNVIVRGETSMIRMDYAAALQLVWRNGLLAVSGRMIDTGGAQRKPSRTESMQLSLRYVTAETPQGFYRMRIDSEDSYPASIQREAIGCVFVVAPGQPHFEITGLPSFDSVDQLINLRGESIAYKAAPQLNDPMLVLTDTSDRTLTTTMSDLVTEPLEWSNEQSPRWTVYWTSERDVEKPMSKLSPIDFRQDGAVVDGFDESTLPTIPAQRTLVPVRPEPLLDDREFSGDAFSNDAFSDEAEF